jgi:hypothetical protein
MPVEKPALLLVYIQGITIQIDGLVVIGERANNFAQKDHNPSWELKTQILASICKQ